MKKAFLIASLAAAVSGAALDNTVVNDFWDTTGYVNGETSAQAATLASPVDTRLKVTRETAAPERFSTFNGLVIAIR